MRIGMKHGTATSAVAMMVWVIAITSMGCESMPRIHRAQIPIVHHMPVSFNSSDVSDPESRSFTPRTIVKETAFTPPADARSHLVRGSRFEGSRLTNDAPVFTS